MTHKILIVDDDAVQRHILNMLIERKMHYTALEAANAPEALKLLQNTSQNISLIILDVHMPGMSGIELLDILSQQYPHIPVIMLTAEEDLQIAVQAMQLGAKDFLNKPLDVHRMEISINNVLKMNLLEREVNRLKHQEEGKFSFNNLIGHNQGLLEVIKQGKKAASSNIPVLLNGETGVGKEVFARAIHGESARVGKPFIAINCGAISPNLIESTLFGHEKGAFTGAINKSPGCFKEADGGTIFLDEVGDLPLDAQVKLLRVLQEKEITPVGSSKAIPVDVRIISATHKDLETSVNQGDFREDLYFRLNVLPITIPALRERPKDIPLLIQHFMERFSATENRPLKKVSPQALKALSEWKWVGNVRELENIIHRAIIMSDNETLALEDFSTLSSPQRIVKLSEEKKALIALPIFQTNGSIKTAAMMERDLMLFALGYYDGNITQAAQGIGMAKSTFYRKLKEHRIN